MPNKQNIAIISNDKVGQNMGGTGIRYYQLAKAMSKYFTVTLFVPDHTDLTDNDFTIIPYDTKKITSSISPHLPQFSCVIAQFLRPNLLKRVKQLKIKYIFDFYDPSPIESLECGRYFSQRKKLPDYNFNLQIVSLQLSTADHILYANEAQKDLYIGLLINEHLLTPATYEPDPNLDALFTYLPFGISSTPPPKSNPNYLQEKFPNISKDDHIILWGGGIWNWFDSLNVIKAVEQLSRTKKNIKLVFMGLVHPNLQIKIMKMATDTVKYCEDKQLTNKIVFFNDTWTPYEERHNYLQNATIGISTHFQNLETRFSFRTRILDYLWTDLPIIATEGDFFSELISKHNLGKVVLYKDPQSIAKAIEELIENKILYNQTKNNINQIKSSFYWENVISALVDKIKNDVITHHPINQRFYANYAGFYKAATKCQLIDKFYEK